jgi:DNA polymerase (family 10)
MLSYLSNAEVASMLEEIARLLDERGESPYRVSAYRNAALTARRQTDSLAGIYERDGAVGLERLEGIGDSLSGTIGEMFRRGRSRRLDRLRREQTQRDPMTTLPSIGPRLAQRIRGELGIDSLEELQRAATDGRLRRVPGLGRKRVQAIHDHLARRFPLASRPQPRASHVGRPSVSLLLELDREYRARAASGRLPRVAPKRFNPAAVRWLPILRAARDGGRFVVHFANTARSHELAREHDWVVIRRLDKPAYDAWTVVTARSGPLRGRRVVRGRERECVEHYRRAQLVQLYLPSTPD